MPRPPYPHNVAEFNGMFPDEEACASYLAACRWPDGFRCPRCGHDQAFALPRRRLWQCKACHYQVSVTAGTVMHRTKTPLLTGAESGEDRAEVVERHPGGVGLGASEPPPLDAQAVFEIGSRQPPRFHDHADPVMDVGAEIDRAAVHQAA